MLIDLLAYFLIPLQPRMPEPVPFVEFNLICVDQRKSLVLEFADKDFWKRSPEDIAFFLKMAEMLHPPEIIPALVEHIDYYDDKAHKTTIDQPIEDFRPVYRVLLAYRNHAVPAVLSYLATHDKSNVPLKTGTTGIDTRIALCVRWLICLNADIQDANCYRRGCQRAREMIEAARARREPIEVTRLQLLLDREPALQKQPEAQK